MFMWVDVSVWLFWLLRCLPSLEYDDLIYSCLEELKALTKKKSEKLSSDVSSRYHDPAVSSRNYFLFTAYICQTIRVCSYSRPLVINTMFSSAEWYDWRKRKTSSKEKSAFLSNCNYLKKETLFLNICIKRVSRSYIMFKRKQHLNSHQSGQGR